MPADLTSLLNPPAAGAGADLAQIIRPGNVQAILAALDPAFSQDWAGMACVVSYSMGLESLLVGHVFHTPGAGASTLDLVRQFASFIATVKEKIGTAWAPVYACFDATKDRTVADRLVEHGFAQPMGSSRGAPRTIMRFPPLTGILFSGTGASQASEAQPIFVSLPGRGRYAVRCLSVPKVHLFSGVREKLVLRQLKFAQGGATTELLRELENLEAKITAARRVSIQPGDAEVHDDLADALALAVWLAREHETALNDARRRGMRTTAPPPGAQGWT
jgi:hypothetical protein